MYVLILGLVLLARGNHVKNILGLKLVIIIQFLVDLCTL